MPIRNPWPPVVLPCLPALSGNVGFSDPTFRVSFRLRHSARSHSSSRPDHFKFTAERRLLPPIARSFDPRIGIFPVSRSASLQSREVTRPCNRPEFPSLSHIPTSTVLFKSTTTCTPVEQVACQAISAATKIVDPWFYWPFAVYQPRPSDPSESSVKKVFPYWRIKRAATGTIGVFRGPPPGPNRTPRPCPG